ncbi:MAG: DUF523 domain-containing protein [Thermodesulfobacteriota bacterium]
MDIKTPVIVSACLVGLDTRHDGGSAPSAETARLLEGRPFIPVCPEQLGGLPTPRPRAELNNGRVVDEHGTDVTENFQRGAKAVLRIAGLCGSREAFLKENSPSCGVSTISMDGAPAPGEGVTTALLRKNGIKPRGF